MAQKKLPKLDEQSKRAIQDGAKTAAGAKALAELADRNLAESDTDAWRKISPQHKEIILYRIRGGELLTTVCKAIGLNPASVRNLAAMDEEFDKALAIAYQHSQHAQVERLYEIPLDTTLSDARAKLLSDNIKWIAARSNRKAWGDSLQVDQNVAVSVTMPTWSVGGPVQEVIDADYTQDPDAEE